MLHNQHAGGVVVAVIIEHDDRVVLGTSRRRIRRSVPVAARCCFGFQAADAVGQFQAVQLDAPDDLLKSHVAYVGDPGLEHHNVHPSKPLSVSQNSNLPENATAQE